MLTTKANQKVVAPCTPLRPVLNQRLPATTLNRSGFRHQVSIAQSPVPN